MASPKDDLLKRLSALLGFDDGAAEVLEHLLSIESSEDLLDYLAQLLGRQDEEVKVFVHDIEQFKLGKPLSLETNEEGTKPPAAAPTTIASAQQRQEQTTAAPATKQAKPKPTSAAKAKMNPKPTPKTAVAKNAAAAAATGGLPPNRAKTKPAPQKAPKEEPPPPKSHPPKGKASVVCGCFGTVHKPLTNCLYCGRISCEREGYQFCPFCSLLIEKGSDGVGGKAWEHKERLLRFDRDFARRTVVLDDQADYFASGSQSWMTEDEKEEAQQKDAERHDKLHKRGKQKLDIAF